MYHALVRLNGRWTSFGLHVPSNQWSDFFNTLKRAYGEEATAYTFWEPTEELGNGFDLRRRVDQEIQYANAVQESRDNGTLPTHDEQGYLLSLAYGIVHLDDVPARM